MVDKEKKEGLSERFTIRVSKSQYEAYKKDPKAAYNSIRALLDSIKNNGE